MTCGLWIYRFNHCLPGYLQLPRAEQEWCWCWPLLYVPKEAWARGEVEMQKEMADNKQKRNGYNGSPYFTMSTYDCQLSISIHHWVSTYRTITSSFTCIITIMQTVFSYILRTQHPSFGMWVQHLTHMPTNWPIPSAKCMYTHHEVHESVPYGVSTSHYFLLYVIFCNSKLTSFSTILYKWPHVTQCWAIMCTSEIYKHSTGYKIITGSNLCLYVFSINKRIYNTIQSSNFKRHLRLTKSSAIENVL